MITKTKTTNNFTDLDTSFGSPVSNAIYEHEAEVLAIRRLLKNKHFKTALDLGGDKGGLNVVLSDYADKVKVLAPSLQQVYENRGSTKVHSTTKAGLTHIEESNFSDESVDLAIMVRVMNHLPDPSVEFQELKRILSKEGFAVIELANYLNVRNRIDHLISGKKIPKYPIEATQESNTEIKTSDCINHNPLTVINQLAHAGLKVEKILSVSNLKADYSNSSVLNNVLLAIEGVLQPTLAKTFFGTRVFFLVQRAA